MLFLWAVVFLIVAIVLALLAFGGIAVAISFFSKMLFLLSFICFLVFIVLMLLERYKLKSNKNERDAKSDGHL